MLKVRGKEVTPARCKEIYLQKSARNAASSRLGRSSSLLLWVLALSEAPEALGRVDPGRADPDYALARYLQPCKSVSECGARQFCTSGRCACPINLGLMGGPQCTTTSKAAWLLISWVLFLGVLELGLAYLHILNLKAHWTQSLPVEDSPSKVHPSPLPQTSAEEALSQSQVSPTRRPLCEVLLTFKSLFSLSSLIFCLAQLVFCISTPLIILHPSSDLGLLYTAPHSVETVAVLLSFNGMAFAYLFVGEIWLDVASRFRLRTFIGTRLSKLLIQLPVVVLCVLTVFYVLVSDSPSAQMLVATLGLGVCALIASGFLTMGASIMIPVIRARAKQAQEARKAVTLSIASAGLGSAMYAVVQEGPKERRSILRWLRRKREEPFRPFLSQIMEVDSAALETSASHGYLNSTGKLSDNPSAGNPTTPRSPRRHGGPIDFLGCCLSRPRFMQGQQAGAPQGEEEEGGVKPMFQATVTRSFDGLAWHVASTAMQVGCASMLSMLAYLVAIVLLDDPQHHHYSTWRGVLGTMCAYAAFPLCHLYANLVCLSVISREAREATHPLRRNLSRLVTAASNLVCSVVCCGLSEDGLFEGSSGVSRGDEPELP